MIKYFIYTGQEINQEKAYLTSLEATDPKESKSIIELCRMLDEESSSEKRRLEKGKDKVLSGEEEIVKLLERFLRTRDNNKYYAKGFHELGLRRDYPIEYSV
jgi:hypothetical protein